MLVTLIELALPLAIFLIAGCIDVNLAREKLLPEEKVTVYYTTEKLAEMEYNFTGVEQIGPTPCDNEPPGRNMER